MLKCCHKSNKHIKRRQRSIDILIFVEIVQMVVISVSSLQNLGTILACIILTNMEMFALNVLLDIAGLTDVKTIQALPSSSSKISHFRLNTKVKVQKYRKQLSLEIILFVCFSTMILLVIVKVAVATDHFQTKCAEEIVFRSDMSTLNMLLDISPLTCIVTISALPSCGTNIDHFRFHILIFYNN